MEAPPLSGRRVRLRPVGTADLEHLYALANDPDISWRWRNRGRSIAFDAFVHQLSAGTLAHFVVESNRGHGRLGYLQAFNASPRNGWCHLAVMLDPGVARGGWAIEAPLLFINYLFAKWDFRKLYATVVDFNFEQFARFAGDRFHVEGRLAENEWHDGRWWDLLIVAMYRSDWERTGPRLVERITRPALQPT